MALIAPRAVQTNYGIPIKELARWRRQGTGPCYYRITPRTIRYEPGELEDWLHSSDSFSTPAIPIVDIHKPASGTDIGKPST